MSSIEASGGPGAQQLTEFALRKAELVSQIGDSLEQVLTQINALNRSMESIIESHCAAEQMREEANAEQIGNEFASVEALWSQFEVVMGMGMGAGQDQTDENEQSRPMTTTTNQTQSVNKHDRDRDRDDGGGP